MEKNKTEKKGSASSLVELIDSRVSKATDATMNKVVKTRNGVVVSYDDSAHCAVVRFPEEGDKATYTFYNKTPELLEDGDTVKVFYTNNLAKGWIGERGGEPNIKETDFPDYVSVKVENTQSLTYDKIERGLLSVDFDVIGNDSAVMFAGNQLCSVKNDGTVNISYKVDGAVESFHPMQIMKQGKNVLSHIYPMPLSIGKHNFAVYILSEDGGKGTVNKGDFVGALSGQISGLVNTAPPNENLVIYYSGVPAGETITLPSNTVVGTTPKYVDWGDDSDIESSAGSAEVSHTYTTEGDYIVTIKSGSKSFAGNYDVSYITRIYFPDDATSIMGAFAYNSLPNLTTLSFGNSATNIRWFFGSCPKLTSLILPQTLKTLDLRGFDDTSVVSFVMPESVTKLTTEDASGVGLYIPVTLKHLEYYSATSGSLLRGYNDGLESVVVGGKAGGTGRYSGAKKLKDFTFAKGNKVWIVNGGAFQNCTTLDNIALPDTITTISNDAFNGCTALKSITIPSNTQTIGNNAFRDSGISSLVFSNSNTPLSIGNEAFKNCDNLTKVSIPSNITSIGYYGFYNSNNIKEVDYSVNSQINAVSQGLFYGTALERIVLPDSITTIYPEAFSNCSSLKEAVLLNVKTIRGGADNGSFQNDVLLAKVDMPIIESIGAKAFKGCTSLIKIEFPKTLTELGDSAFSSSGLESVDIVYPDVELGGGCFSECKNLKVIKICEGITSIPYKTFYNSGASQLESVTIPNSVTVIGEQAFKYTPIKNVMFGNGLTTIKSSAFFGADNLRSAIFPNSLTTIEAEAFAWCSSLKSVVIPESVKNIGGWAFWGAAFTSVTISKDCVLGGNAFPSGCEINYY